MEDIHQQPNSNDDLAFDADVPMAMPTPVTPAPAAAEGSAETSPSISRASAPSPAPTEIVFYELSTSEIHEDIQSRGIKIRDYAYDPAPDETRAPEVFDPLIAWNIYEDTLKHNANANRTSISGKNVRRLLDLHWVPEADKQRWLPQDYQALEVHDSRPHYPWIAYNIPQPTAETLALTARQRFLEINRDQLGPQTMRLTRHNPRPAYNARAQEKKREAEEPAQSSAGENAETASKRRRLENGPASPCRRSTTPPPASSPASPFARARTPSMMPSIPEEHRSPLGFVNGLPPKQYPAGKPSDYPHASSSQNTHTPTHACISSPPSPSRPSNQKRSLRRTESSINVCNGGPVSRRRSLDRSDSSQLIHAASS